MALRRIIIDGDRRDRRAFDVPTQSRGRRKERCQGPCGEEEFDLRFIDGLKLCSSCEAQTRARTDHAKAVARADRIAHSEAQEAVKNMARRTRPVYEP